MTAPIISIDQFYHNTEKIYGDYEVILPSLYEKGFDPPRITPWHLVVFKHSESMPLFQFITTSTFYPLKRAFQVQQIHPFSHNRGLELPCTDCKVYKYDLHHLFYEVIRELPYVSQQGIGCTSMATPVVKDMHFIKRGKIKEFCNAMLELHNKTCPNKAPVAQ